MKVECGQHYLAFVLDEQCRKKLLELFPPQNEVVKCHHITIAYEIKEEDIPYLQQIVDSNMGFDALVWVSAPGVEMFTVLLHMEDELNVSRVDGKYYHITHSHGQDLESAYSNVILAQCMENQRDITRTPVTMNLTGEFQLIPYR